MKIAQHGFTLLELMTALAVLAVLVALATPSFREFSANSRISAASNSLLNALAVARSEALLRSTPVSVCASTDALTCRTSKRDDWSNGWIVFTDNSGTAGKLDSTDDLIQSWPGPGGTTSVSLTSANDYVRFDARGMNGGAAATLTTWFPGCKGNNSSQIIVTAVGSPQATKVACP
jgi:type IV fimbrial biogenesis protein FimT